MEKTQARKDWEGKILSGEISGATIWEPREASDIHRFHMIKGSVIPVEFLVLFNFDKVSSLQPESLAFLTFDRSVIKVSLDQLRSFWTEHKDHPQFGV